MVNIKYQLVEKCVAKVNCKPKKHEQLKNQQLKTTKRLTAQNN